jgi:hypothetical protein
MWVAYAHGIIRRKHGLKNKNKKSEWFWKVSLLALMDINVSLLNFWQLVKFPPSPSTLFSHIPLLRTG